MRIGLIIVLLLALTAVFAGSAARAHEAGPASTHHGSAVEEHRDAHSAAANDDAKRGGLHPHTQGDGSHRSASHCMTAVGCAGAASITGEECHVPAPQRMAAAQLLASGERPRSVEIPVEDQPPRSS